VKVVKNIFIKNNLFVGVALAVISFSPTVSFSQDLDLSDYLEAPAQDILQDSSVVEEATPTVPLNQGQDVVSEEDNPLNLSPATLSTGVGDALPAASNVRLRVEDTGLDISAVDGVRTPINSLDFNRQSSEELAEEIRQEAFDAAITGLFPMRPAEIKEVLKQYDVTTRAAEEPVFGVPTPVVNVATISLDPGVAPLVLKTAIGHITTLSLLDATGAPWPIQDISWAGDFEVIEPEEGGHIIRVTPMAIAAYGNMSIRLLKLKTPVTIRLSTSKDEVQYRVDARIAEFGPQSTPQIIEGGSERVAGNDLIMSVLDGTPPLGATKLSVGGVDGRTTAYKINNMTYVRTPLTLLSPGWQQSVSSADGMNVYALSEAPVLLLSDKGRFTRANLTVGKDPFDE
jgi:intracellular multiplication protein IcmK